MRVLAIALTAVLIVVSVVAMVGGSPCSPGGCSGSGSGWCGCCWPG